MSLCINPEYKKIRVNVEGGYFLFTMRNPTAEESFQFNKQRRALAKMKNGQLKFKSLDEFEKLQVRHVESLLEDLAAFDDNDNPDEAMYYDANEKGLVPLTTSVPNWGQYIPWKIRLRIANLLDEVEAEVEGDLEKN